MRGAFKFLKACHAIARLMSSEPSRMFAVVSSGNHEQGVVLACSLHAATAHVVIYSNRSLPLSMQFWL
jgi:threonine dehydratase